MDTTIEIKGCTLVITRRGDTRTATTVFPCGASAERACRRAMAGREPDSMLDARVEEHGERMVRHHLASCTDCEALTAAPRCPTCGALLALVPTSRRVERGFLTALVSEEHDACTGGCGYAWATRPRRRG